MLEISNKTHLDFAPGSGTYSVDIGASADEDVNLVFNRSEDFRRTFRIGERSSGSSLVTSHEYEIPEVTQPAYMSMFSKIAQDFSMNAPSLHRERSKFESTAPFVPILTDNTPEIVYGYGDPCVLKTIEDGTGRVSYYLVATSNGPRLPIYQSYDLVNWTFVNYIFPNVESEPKWAATYEQGVEYWAPEMHFINGYYVVCFSAREPERAMCIGLAWSKHPGGPFTSALRPLIRGGVIDSHLFVEDDGEVTIFWKEDSNEIWPSLLIQIMHSHPEIIEKLFPDSRDYRTACLNTTFWPWVRNVHPMERFFVQHVFVESVVARFTSFRSLLDDLIHKTDEPALRSDLAGVFRAMRTKIYAQKLDVDRWMLEGDRKIVLRNDVEWEGHVVEGIWVTKQKGKYYMFYAGNDFSTSFYGIGVASSDCLLGPYTKLDQAFLKSTEAWWGPGHPSVAQGLDGEPWIFLHAFKPGEVGYKKFRALLGLPLQFDHGNEVSIPA